MAMLSLCMIVKNEEQYIERCLESVKGIVDEIIIVDTGSTDSTLLRVQKYNPRIYHMEWKQDFSEARNLALEQAKGDWILVLDADEEVFGEDACRLRGFMDTTTHNGFFFQIHNLLEESGSSHCTVHMGIRMFRNQFRYKGAIHEQLEALVPGTPMDFKSCPEIRLRHYGYITGVIESQNKSERNISILEKLLKENGKDGFHLFNMGNEYLSLGDYKKALSYYNKANECKDIGLAYSPHLLYRRASAMHYLNQDKESLAALEEAIVLYPACIDYVYLKGLIHKKLKRYSLAIDCFEQCLTMEAPPGNLIFFPDTGGIRPLIELGTIYSNLDDHIRSANYFSRALGMDPSRYDIIYQIGELLNKALDDKTEVARTLESLFADPSFPPNLLLLTDILLHEGLEAQAGKYLAILEGAPGHQQDRAYLKGRYHFYQKEYRAASKLFEQVIDNGQDGTVLSDLYSYSFEYYVLCCILLQGDIGAALKRLRDEEGDAPEILRFFLSPDPAAIFQKENAVMIYRMLSKILRVQDFTCFEASLEILNHIDSKDVLLELAEVYYKNGFKEMALKTILRSVKELDIINSKGVYILNKEFSL